MLRDGRSRTTDECEREVAEHEPPGEAARRVSWALAAMTRSGDVRRDATGGHQITDSGRYRLVLSYTGRPADQHRRAGRHRAEPRTDPLEQMESALRLARTDLTADLLVRVRGMDLGSFERTTHQLLQTMGYRADPQGAGRLFVDQDGLGLRRVHAQTLRRRPTECVEMAEVVGFAHALRAARADQGILVTTAEFSAGAHEHAAGLATRITLVDGDRLAAMMIRQGVGVRVRRTVDVLEVDERFFA